MDINLEIGIKNKKEKIVKKEDTAMAIGSGSLEVFSTPAMIALVENTCMEAVEDKLPKGYTTVGIHVDISHIEATKLGKKVCAEGELIEQDRRKLVFKVYAYDEDKKISEGIHERFIINIDKFLNKL